MTNVDYGYLLPLLAQGSAPPQSESLPFDVVVLAARQYQPELPGYHVMHVPLDDARPDARTRREIRVVARAVAEHVRAGHRVLVTCMAGRNRSGVIAGLAMVDLGVRPIDAVRRIQEKREGLSNDYFRAMVLGMI